MEERERVQKRVQKATDDPDVEAHLISEGDDEDAPDVEGHKKLKRDEAPTIEREQVTLADDDDDEPDVEAHRKLH